MLNKAQGLLYIPTSNGSRLHAAGPFSRVRVVVLPVQAALSGKVSATWFQMRRSQTAWTPLTDPSDSGYAMPKDSPMHFFF